METEGNGVEISVVVPMHNEEDNVKELSERLVKVLKGLNRSFEIILVDDGSSDKTFEEIKKANQMYREVGGISLRKNAGQTAATRAGIEHSTGGIIITMDGDLEHVPEDIPRVVERFGEGCDVVNTWRYDRKRERFGKRIPSKISNMLARLMTEVPAHDFGSGFKAYRREALFDVPLYGNFHRYVLALVLYGRGFKLCEVKIKYRRRVKGKTKYGLKRLVKGLIDLLYISFYIRLRKNRPSSLRYLKKIGSLYYGKDAVEGKRTYEVEDLILPKA